jgi:hypothetical protein
MPDGAPLLWCCCGLGGGRRPRCATHAAGRPFLHPGVPCSLPAPGWRQGVGQRWQPRGAAAAAGAARSCAARCLFERPAAPNPRRATQGRVAGGGGTSRAAASSGGGAASSAGEQAATHARGRLRFEVPTALPGPLLAARGARRRVQAVLQAHTWTQHTPIPPPLALFPPTQFLGLVARRRAPPPPAGRARNARD